MTAAVHLLTGPAHAGTTRRLLERYRAIAERYPGAALWLGPTRRGVEALRERLACETAGTLDPQLYTFQDFAEELVRVNAPRARPLTRDQRRLLVEDVVATLHQRGELPHFAGVIETRGFAEGVLALLSEMKRNEIWPNEFARAAYRRGYEGGRVARHIGGRNISSKERQCARIYARYQQVLTKHDLWDLEGRQWRARDLLDDGLRRPFENVRAVFVAGFTDFTCTQREILAALCHSIDELWVALLDESADERAELFTRPRAAAALLCGTPERVSVEPGGAKLPAGLAHLQRQLFRPLRRVEQSPDAAGLLCIAAPGMLGEARMVARAVKSLLLDGTLAEDIVLTMRDVPPYAGLLREVFDEYGVPVDVEGVEPLTRNPAVALLLRAVRLPEEDWPFAGVTALLRSDYFHPEWPEAAAGGADAVSARYASLPTALQAEALLRLLGEPRDRRAYLRAVRHWASHLPPGLEDEEAEASRRRRTHELAKVCLPFFERFFGAWDAAPQEASLPEHVDWLCRFADDIGLTRTAAQTPQDAAAWRRLWDELQHWIELETLLHPAGRALERKTFLRRLSLLAAETGLARTPRGAGRVRVLSAEQARHLEADHLFVMGLGERSFPRLTPAEPIFDESERLGLREAGLEFPCVSDRMPDEMLLFYQLVTRARRRLVLSYPAVDDRGQELLPSSFLEQLLGCFTDGAVPVLRRTMLIERYDEDRPMSAAEYRVRVAASPPAGGLAAAGLSRELSANLAGAALMVRRRFRDESYSPYDGLLRDAAVVGQVREMFRPDRIFSPTALEDYVTCPFRFFAGHVLRLEELSEPREEIEVTRRGQAFHRALARLHRHLQRLGVHLPAAEVEDQLRQQLTDAVNEDVERAPSPAAQELWRLEGRRLVRLAGRYRVHWERFVKPWLERHVEPRPHFFEVDFGLPSPDGKQPASALTIKIGDVQISVSGRIDRVDVAQLPDGVGFWILDYKTGRASHYTSADLANFHRLQLTLYAMAVEQVLLAEHGARPLGMAYWLVADTGVKVVMPPGGVFEWYEQPERWHEVREQLERVVAALAAHIRAGDFPLRPRKEDCTETCEFAQICRITQSRSVGKTWQLQLPLA
jgi:ATP-dependent helicase/DNAse subunit B